MFIALFYIKHFDIYSSTQTYAVIWWPVTALHWHPFTASKWRDTKTMHPSQRLLNYEVLCHLPAAQPDYSLLIRISCLFAQLMRVAYIFINTFHWSKRLKPFSPLHVCQLILKLLRALCQLIGVTDAHRVRSHSSWTRVFVRNEQFCKSSATGGHTKKSDETPQCSLLSNTRRPLTVATCIQMVLEAE